MIVSCVRSTIAERSLLSQGDGVLVACSGGADSGAMLHALTRLAPELDLSLFAASVDHGLRPESGRDVEVARELSKRLEVRFAALRVEVPPGPSRQAHARDTRYEALREEAARMARRTGELGLSAQTALTLLDEALTTEGVQRDRERA